MKLILQTHIMYIILCCICIAEVTSVSVDTLITNFNSSKQQFEKITYILLLYFP